MQQKSIKKNYIYNLTYQLLLILIPLVTIPYLSRVIHADGIGLYSYIDSICCYFVLFATLGISFFGQREISYVRDDLEKRSIIFWETNIIELISSVLCIGLYVVFSLFQSNSILYLVLTFNIVGVIFNISWFFQGMEEFGKLVLFNIIFKILLLVFIFTCVKSYNDLVYYFLGVTVVGVLNNLSYWIVVPKFITKPNFRKIHPSRHIKTIISLFIPTIAIQVYTVLDKTMIGVITQDVCENGFYDLAVKISKIILTVVTALGTVMIPRIGYLYEKGCIDEVRNLMYRSYRFVWALGIPMTIGLVTVSGNFVPWFLGDGFEKVVPLLSILSFLILAIGINNVTGVQYFIPTKRQNTFTITVIIGAITNCLLNLFLIYYFKSIGAAIASVSAETVIALVQLYIVRKELSSIQILKSAKTYFLAGITMGVGVYSISLYLSPFILNTIFLSVLGALVYLFILIMLKDEFLLSIINKLKNKIV